MTPITRGQRGGRVAEPVRGQRAEPDRRRAGVERAVRRVRGSSPRRCRPPRPAAPAAGRTRPAARRPAGSRSAWRPCRTARRRGPARASVGITAIATIMARLLLKDAQKVASSQQLAVVVQADPAAAMPTPCQRVKLDADVACRNGIPDDQTPTRDATAPGIEERASTPWWTHAGLSASSSASPRASATRGIVLVVGRGEGLEDLAALGVCPVISFWIAATSTS